MKAALIGAGQISRQHLACLKVLPGVELAAICDLSPEQAVKPSTTSKTSGRERPGVDVARAVTRRDRAIREITLRSKTS